jgi:DNA-binding NarL/FixJ family response regulator/anti-sigma regulatory factor (Ser/Thr protein kinase)
MACVRILIADDHELVRQGLRALLSSRPTWEVCGEAVDGVEAVEKAAQLRPDIVLLDVSMPRMNGLEAAPVIRRESPVSQIVIVSQHDPAEMLRSALKVGARGFVSKSDIGSNLLSTIESIVQTAPRPVAANGAEARAAAAAPTRSEHSAEAALRHEEMLRKRSAQFEILVNQAPIGVFLLDGELRIRQVNPVARPAFDPIRDLVGRDFCDVLHELLAQNDAEELVRIFRHTLATGESHHATEQARPRPDRPATEYYDWRVDRIPLPEGGHGVVCYFRDVSVEMQARAALQEARDHLESRVRERTEELESAYKSLRVLSMRMMQMQDEDRRRIARDLHDSAGQLLAALGMELASLNRRAAALSSELADDIQSSLQLVQQLTQEIRTASYLLHPPLLDDAGLSGALRWYVAGLSKRSGIAITLELDEALGRLPRDLEAAVFHIVQESLMNIHRHSGSKTATLRVARSDGRLFLDIEDEGSGIPADKLREIQTQGSGVGIAGMRERVLHFNGDIHITSVTAGTRIAVTFPVEPGGVRAESLSLNS